MNYKNNTFRKILKTKLSSNLINTFTYRQKEIDRLYFDLKDYVKTLYNVDRLNELSENDKEECKIELNLINKFSKL